MAAFYFRCRKCKHEFGKMLPKAQPTFECTKCGKPAKRAVRVPTTRVTETLDNGLMARRVERIQGATELFRERSQQDKIKGRVEVHISPGILEPVRNRDR